MKLAGPGSLAESMEVRLVVQPSGFRSTPAVTQSILSPPPREPYLERAVSEGTTRKCLSWPGSTLHGRQRVAGPSQEWRGVHVSASGC